MLKKLLSNKFILTLSLFTLDTAYADIETDRPDITESSYSVEEGYFQFENSIYNFERDDSTKDHSFLEINSKYGVNKNTDLQLVTTMVRASEGEQAYFENFTFRVKRNLIRTESGTGLGILPYWGRSRHNTNDADFGMAIPFEFSLSDQFYMALMPQFSRQTGTNSFFEYLNTASVGYFVNDDNRIFVELVGILRDLKENNEEYYFNYGYTHLLNSNLQLDLAVNHGINQEYARDLLITTGLSIKFN